MPQIHSPIYYHVNSKFINLSIGFEQNKFDSKLFVIKVFEDTELTFYDEICLKKKLKSLNNSYQTKIYNLKSVNLLIYQVLS